MEKAKKKNIKRIIALVCVVAVVAVLAAMPLIAKQEPEPSGPKASILSGKAEVGSIQTQLIGGGSLAEEDATTLSVPAAVKLTSFLVANGDLVTQGTPIASVDRVTVMTAITQVQTTLETLSEQIQAAADTDEEETVTALAGGKVKQWYAQEGSAVQSVMLEHGALGVLSLDGLLAVDLETDSTLPVGTQVTVTLADGKTATGKITVNLVGDMTVTLEDKDYAVGQEVQITAEDSTVLGSGVLYVYSPWNVTAYAGTVDRVKVKEGDQLDPGDPLLVLSEVGDSAAYRQLVSRRQAYEDLMLELFQMYQTETVTAPCDGVVSGVDKNSLQLLSSDGTYEITFLSNSPDGKDEQLYLNYLAQVTLVAENGWAMKVNPQGVPVSDYLKLTDIPVDTTVMTKTVLHTQTDLPIFTLAEGGWQLVPQSNIKQGDLMLFAANESGFVWGVLLPEKQTPTRPGGTATPDTPVRPDGPSQPDNSSQPDVTPENPGGTQTNPGGTTTKPDASEGTGSLPQGGSSSSFPQGGVTQPEEETQLYAMDMTQIAAVTPQQEMTMDITVDEQDVAALKVGMEARIRIDALGGEKHTATITHIGNTGTNNGGSSKFTVTITVEKTENMLPGMTATASVEISSADQVLTVPAEALVEQGNETLIYTGYDEENEVLTNPVVVKVGVSDGKTVEILEGLTQGQTYYYAYYDTLEISYTPDFGSTGMFGR